MSQYWLNGGTPSTTPAHHWHRIGPMFGLLCLLGASSQTLACFMRPASRHFSKEKCFQMQNSACSGDVTGCNDAYETLNTRYFHVGPRTSTTWTKNVSSPFTFKTQYCGGGGAPWPRGSVLGLRPPVLEFRILCLEDSVILFISPSSGGSPGPV